LSETENKFSLTREAPKKAGQNADYYASQHS
jgi:hypothetical protein